MHAKRIAVTPRSDEYGPHGLLDRGDPLTQQLATQVFGGELSHWDQFMLEVQQRTCMIADAETVDMIYTLYLHEASVDLVVSTIPGLQRAAETVRQARAALLEMGDVMQLDRDPYRAFNGRAHEPTIGRPQRAAFIRRLPRPDADVLAIIGWAFVVAGVFMALIYAIHKAHP